MFTRFRCAVLSLITVAAAAAGLATASFVTAASASTSTRTAKTERVVVGVQVTHFIADGRKVRAGGLVTAKLSGNQGKPTTIKEPVALTANTSGGCKVLHLYLKKLNLTLLGLNVALGQVNLNVTGHNGQGPLGTLFCELTKAKISTTARAADARTLTTDMQRRQRALRFTVYVHPAEASMASAAGATCPVLNLVLGPLDLQLLGLEVSLNQVTLNVTATNGGGVLGDLFCQLADSTVSTTGTTTSTTGTSTTSTT